MIHQARPRLFSPLGQWVMVLGDMLGRPPMPAVRAAAHRAKDGDPPEAAAGLRPPQVIGAAAHARHEG